MARCYNGPVTAAATGFRDPALGPALDAALVPAGRAAFYDRLRRASGLPSPRVNQGLVAAFGVEAAKRGAAVDALLAAMCAVDEDVAPYGHVDEILPILGVAGTAARATADPKARKKLVEALEDMACDRRSRVRDGVAGALVSVGLVDAGFSATLARWIDDEQPWLLRAVAVALSDTTLVGAFPSDTIADLTERLLLRVEREHRAGRRHEAFRRAVTAVQEALPTLIQRHPVAVLGVLVRFTKSLDEDVTDAIAATADKLHKARVADLADALRDAIGVATKPARDPRWERLPGKRGRGKR